MFTFCVRNQHIFRLFLLIWCKQRNVSAAYSQGLGAQCVHVRPACKLQSSLLQHHHKQERHPVQA